METSLGAMRAGSFHRIEHPNSIGKQLPANFTGGSAHVIFNRVLPEWRNWQTQQTQKQNPALSK
jgi:hypothetical protein